MPERLAQASTRGRLVAVFHAHLESNGEFYGASADRRHFGAARVVRWRKVALLSALWLLMSTHHKLGNIFGNYRTMIREEDVLAALDKPRAVYGLLQRLDPGNKSTDALQDLLMRMRTEGKVKFDIKTGKWSKA
jgi:hypothetical protein